MKSFEPKNSLTYFIKTFQGELKSKKLIVNCALFTGYLADQLGSYASAFYLAGGFLLLCAVLPFILLCVKAKNRNDESDQGMIVIEEDEQIKNVTA